MPSLHKYNIEQYTSCKCNFLQSKTDNLFSALNYGEQSDRINGFIFCVSVCASIQDMFKIYTRDVSSIFTSIAFHIGSNINMK